MRHQVKENLQLSGLKFFLWLNIPPSGATFSSTRDAKPEFSTKILLFVTFYDFLIVLIMQKIRL